jgi:hypothetical protein
MAQVEETQCSKRKRLRLTIRKSRVVGCHCGALVSIPATTRRLERGARVHASASGDVKRRG